MSALSCGSCGDIIAYSGKPRPKSNPYAPAQPMVKAK